MLGDVAALLGAVVSLFQVPIVIYGFEFSLWQVFLFMGFGGVLAFVLREVFLGD